MKKFCPSFVVEPEHLTHGDFSVDSGPFVNVLVTQSAIGRLEVRTDQSGTACDPSFSILSSLRTCA